MLKPGRYNLTIYQGATFERTFTWTAPDPMDTETMIPVDLTGCTARMQLRAKVTSTGDPIFEATTEDGRITLGDADGTIDIVFSATDTAALHFRQCVYDLEVQFPGGEVDRLLMGNVKLSAEVTR
jgi:hypothetical protein